MNTIRVLAIEDDPRDLVLLRRSLVAGNGERFEVTTAGLLSSGLAAAGSGGRYDVVLLDMHLPDGSGLGNLQCVVEALPDTAVIVVSGDLEEKLALEALRCGADDCLIKSGIGGGILPRAIRYALERRRARTGGSHAPHDAPPKLTAAVLHEFNNLIFAISGNIDLLDSGEEDCGAQASRYERIRVALRRMSRISGDLQATLSLQEQKPVELKSQNQTHTAPVPTAPSSLPATST